MYISEREDYNNRFISNILKTYSDDQNPFFLQYNINLASVMFAGFIEENPDFIKNFHLRNCVIGFGVFLTRFESYSDIEQFFSTSSDEPYQLILGLNTIKRTFQDLTDRLRMIPNFEDELKKQFATF